MDRGAALKRAGGDMQLLRELAGLFLQDTPYLVTEMEQAVASADWKLLERTAHRLKGAVGNFDAKCLHELLAPLETAARAEESTRIEELFPQVKRELSKFQTELDGLFKEAA